MLTLPQKQARLLNAAVSVLTFFAKQLKPSFIRDKMTAILHYPAIALLLLGLRSQCVAADGVSLRGTDERLLQDLPLPNWAAPWEKDVSVESRTEQFMNEKDWGFEKAASIQPPTDVRLPAEFEPTAAVLMSWKAYSYILQEISIEVARAGADVLMIQGPASLGGVPADKYFPLSLPLNSVWARDYGPVGVILNGKSAVIDTRYRHYMRRVDDDRIPCSIAQKEGIECYSTDLILDGGNLMSDGKGNIFMTTRTYDWNSHLTRFEVDALLKSFFGADTIHALDYAKDSSGDPSDGTGHIDMFAKILDQCVVLVAETNDAPYRQPLEDAANYFRSTECAPGQTYAVYRVPGWVSNNQSWSTRQTWYTYTNSLIVNGVVIMPTYRNAPNDEAMELYRSARSDLQVVGINTDASIDQGGSVHCLTRQIPRVG